MNLQQIRQFSKDFSQLCSQLDYKWVLRARKLKTFEVIRLLLLQVETSRRSLRTGLAHLHCLEPSHSPVSPSALSQARQRMPWQNVRQLFRYTCSFYQNNAPQTLWKSRRIFAIDGTRLTLNHTFMKKKYIRTSKKAHYPQAMMTVLYQLKAGIPYDAQFCRHFDERRAALHHLKHLQPGDVLVVDRGFFQQNF